MSLRYLVPLLFTDNTQGAPVAALTGNGVPIANGDATPSVTDDTDFGETAKAVTVTKTYTITNSGTSDLNGLSVSAPAGYTVTVQPDATLAPAANTTFSVRFDATAYQTYSGNVTIVSDELPDFVFAITGAATLNAFITTLSPMLYYKFNEASGNLLNYGSETGAVGVVSGATQAQTGQLGAGEAYSLDGVDDVITIANADVPNVKALTTQRWAFLVNATNEGEASSGVFFQWGNGAHLIRFISSGRIRVEIDTNATDALAITNITQMPLGSWAWLFMDYDDADALTLGRRVRLWRGVSGTLTAMTLATNTAGTGTVATPSSTLQLGNRSALDNTFNGLMDIAIADSGLWTTDAMQNLIDAAGV